MKKNDYPRDLAIRVLTRVLSGNEPLDEALASSLTDGLAPGARGWLQEVCSGTLRWKGRLDLALDSVALRKKPTGWLRKALLIAAYQLIVQERVQPGAVVSETVSEIKRKEGEAPARFANAILRKIADHAQAWRNLKADAAANPAAWASLPPWLWEQLVRQHGREWAENFALACLERPKLWVRARRGESELASWAQPGPIEESWQATEGGQITERSGFSHGGFFVQDISSQTLVHEISAEVSRLEGGGRQALERKSALDLCAAPGGKAVGMAWNGWKVGATDRDEARLGLLRRTVERVAPEVIILARSAVANLPLQDLVWVDAPCSGTGIIRRHPDVRWLKREKDLESLFSVQHALLEEAWSRVRPGGFLAYSVCSVLKQEGPELLSSMVPRSYWVREWFLTPQAAPFGDGFWAALARKPG